MCMKVWEKLVEKMGVEKFAWCVKERKEKKYRKETHEKKNWKKRKVKRKKNSKAKNMHVVKKIEA